MAKPHGHGSSATANGPRSSRPIARANRPSPLVRASNLAHKAMTAGRNATGERRARLHKAWTKASEIRGRLEAESQKGWNKGNPDRVMSDHRGSYDPRTGGWYTGD